jgi:hypothetical protein
MNKYLVIGVRVHLDSQKSGRGKTNSEGHGNFERFDGH